MDTSCVSGDVWKDVSKNAPNDSLPTTSCGCVTIGRPLLGDGRAGLMEKYSGWYAGHKMLCPLCPGHQHSQCSNTNRDFGRQKSIYGLPVLQMISLL